MGALGKDVCGGLECVEHESGALAIDASFDDGVHDLLNGDEHGIGVVEQGKDDVSSDGGGGSLEWLCVVGVTSACFVVPMTEVGITESDGSADVSAGVDVTA